MRLIYQRATELRWTPLMYAARYGAPEDLDLLIELGASVHVRDIADATPLHKAACEGGRPRPSMAHKVRRQLMTAIVISSLDSVLESSKSKASNTKSILARMPLDVPLLAKARQARKANRRVDLIFARPAASEQIRRFFPKQE